MNHQNELKEFYEQADFEDAYERQWGYSNSVAAEYWGMRDQLVFDAISEKFGEQLNNIRALEVGTGYGHELAKLRRVGVAWEGLTGIDFLLPRLKRARKSYPAISFAVADAVTLPFLDASFDIVLQFTCVMHALTQHVQRAMCAEMIRVLRPGGIIVWWDLAPLRWRTLCLRRFLLAATGSATLPHSVRNTLQTFRELLSSTIRQESLQHCSSLKALLVDVGDLEPLFETLEVKALRAGVDFEVWRSIWHLSPKLARLFWRSGYFSGHCFATARKL
ncbi:MAG TPA: class I SAM-dependent methyltransferase [Pyrinomonadaceae bacterium]